MKKNYYERPESRIIILQLSNTLLQTSDGGMDEGGEV